MTRIMIRSKIHRATVTATLLDYEGSIAIDPDLLDAADIIPGEQVHVLNVNTGARLVTYVLLGERGTGEIMLNGPAARDAQPGDQVVIITYAPMSDAEAAAHTPRIVLVDTNNRITAVKGAPPATKKRRAQKSRNF
ncbi:MAG: aspartate 1-decarboxylase [Kiritimatiellae bacterium]|nr:aspartate 1-decarboxylase [Kiritimatiellia bacterium]